MNVHTIANTNVESALIALAQAARATEKNPSACNSICHAVANLVAGAGTFGGAQQTRVMDMAQRAGFVPEFYAGAIRVTWTPR